MPTKKVKVEEEEEEVATPPQQRVNEVGYLPPSSKNNVNPSISLKEYFDSQILEKEKRYEQRFVAQQDAVLKAETATDKRFESVNEFRQTLADQQNTFASKIEMNTAFDYVGKNITKNQEDINEVRLKTTSFITTTEHGLRIAELQLQITALRDIINTTSGKTNATDPATEDKFTTISKTLDALANRITSLNDTRSMESGATAKSTSIFSRAETIIPIVIAGILLVLRFMGK